MEKLPIIFFIPGTYKGDQYVGFFKVDDSKFKRIDISIAEKDHEVEAGIYEGEELAMELVAFTNYKNIEVEEFDIKLREAIKSFSYK